MRRNFLFAFICLAIFGCKKENTGSANPSELAGNWRMIAVKNNLANTVTTKPPAINGEVDITFQFSTSVAGLMYGVTPTNSLSGDYVTGMNRTLLIRVVTATQVMETSWGLEFLSNITFAQDFNLDNAGKLNVNTSANKTLIFIRQ